MTDDTVLDELKQQFISRDKTEREKFFSAASQAAEFTNSQLFFFQICPKPIPPSQRWGI